MLALKSEMVTCNWAIFKLCSSIKHDCKPICFYLKYLQLNWNWLQLRLIFTSLASNGFFRRSFSFSFGQTLGAKQGSPQSSFQWKRFLFSWFFFLSKFHFLFLLFFILFSVIFFLEKSFSQKLEGDLKVAFNNTRCQKWPTSTLDKCHGQSFPFQTFVFSWKNNLYLCEFYKKEIDRKEKAI